MKKSNVRVGMKVTVKDGDGLDFKGQVMVVREVGDMGVFCTPPHNPMRKRSYYHFDEIKRVSGHAYF